MADIYTDSLSGSRKRNLGKDQSVDVFSPSLSGQQKSEKTYTPRAFGTEKSTMGAGWDFFGLSPTDSADFGLVEISNYLTSNPEVLEEARKNFSPNVGTPGAWMAGGPKSDLFPVYEGDDVEFIKKLAVKGLIELPIEVFDPKKYTDVRNQEPTRFDVEQNRINDLLLGSESLKDEQGKSRINTETSPLSPWQRYKYALLPDDTKKEQFLEENFGEKGEIVRHPITVDQETGEILEYEFLVGEKWGGPLHRVDPYGQTAATRNGGLDAFLGIVTGLANEETRKDYADALGVTLSPRNIGATAAAVGTPVGVGVSLVGRTLLTGGRAVAVGVADYFGQFVDKAVALEEAGEVLDQESVESFMAGGFELFGKTFMDVIRLNTDFLKSALLRGAGPEAREKLAAGFRLGVDLGPVHLMTDIFAKRIMDQAAALRGKRFEDATRKLNTGLVTAIRDKITSLGGIINSVGKIDPKDLVKVVEQDRRDLATAIMTNPTLDIPLDDMTDAAVQMGMPMADMAFRAFTRVSGHMKDLRNVYYKKVFDSNEGLEINLDLDPLKKAIRDAREGTPVGQRGALVDTGLLDDTGSSLMRDGTSQTPAEGKLGGSLDTVLDTLEQLQINGPITNTTGDAFGVLEQLHRLRINLKQQMWKAAESSDAGITSRLAPVERQLDELFDQTLIGQGGASRDLLALANNTSRQIADTFKSTYIANAMANGESRAYASLVEDLINGKQALDAPTRALLKDIKDTLVVMSKDAPRALQKKILNDSALFKDQLGNSVLAGLASEPAVFVAKLRSLTALPLETADQMSDLLENPAMKFLFPDSDRRKQLVRMAKSNIDYEKKLSVAAARGIDEESSSMDIAQFLMDKLKVLPEEAGPKEIITLFEKLGADRTKPQMKEYFLNKMLNQSLREDPTKGKKAEILDLKTLREEIENLRTTNPRLSKVFDWAFEGDRDLSQMVEDLSLVSGNMARSLQDSGNSIQAGAAASVVQKLDFASLFGLYKQLITSGLMARAATSPVSMDQLIRFTNDAKRGSSSSIIKEITGYALRLQGRDNPLNFFKLGPPDEGDHFKSVEKEMNSIPKNYFENLRVKSSRKGIIGGMGNDRLGTVPQQPQALPRRQASRPSATSQQGLANIPTNPLPREIAGSPTPRGIAGLAASNPDTASRLAGMGLGLWT